MAKNKTLKVLSTGTVAGMIAAAVLSSQAFAAVDAYSVKIGDDVLKYDKAALTESFLASKAGEAAPLYEDFTAKLTQAKGFYAFSDAKTGKFVSYDDIQAKFLAAKAAGEAFVVDDYTESADAKVIEVPTVKKVVVIDGKVVVESETAELKVEAVSAINATVLAVNGTGLDKLTSENITVGDNTVVSVTASEDGKTATVKLGSALVPDTETKVTVTVDSVAKEFTATYKLDVTTVAVDVLTYDDDTEDQYVTFKVNGQTADVNDLFVNGYSVAFEATKKVAGVTSNATSELFADATTGELNTGLTAGTVYKVQVTVSKGSNVFISEQADVTVKNFELVASSIESYELTNTTASNMIQKSSTLVVGDDAVLTELVAMQNATKTTLTAVDITTAVTAGTLDIKTSNAAVVSVDEDLATLTANTPGTATITITYGNITKTIKLTVAQGEREISRVTPKSTSLTTVLAPLTNNTVDFYAYDQYGDPVNAAALTVESSNDSVLADASATAGATDAEGKGTLTITPAATGSTSVVFKNADGKTVGSLAVKVTDNATTARKVLEIDKPTADEIDAGQSEDATIDKADEVNVIYQLQPYTAENIKLATIDLSAYTVKFDKNVVSVNGDATGEAVAGAAVLTITPSTIANAKLGYSDIAVYDTNNILVSKVRVTVVDNTPKLSSITFKSVPEVTFAGKKIDYKTVFTVTEVAGDDIIKGINLTKTASSVIRIDEVNSTLYLDKNGDATYTDETTDTLLGTITISKASGSSLGGTFTNIITGDTTVAGDEGTIIITVSNTDSTPKIVSSTSISVNVPD